MIQWQRAIIFIVLASFSFCNDSSAAGKTRFRLLFVGNSLTYTHDIPAILKKIGNYSGMEIETKCLCKPNYSLEDHWNEPQLSEAVTTGKFDYVIVQQGPSSQPLGRKVLREYGMRVKNLASESNAKVVFYTVWPSLVHYHTFDDVIKSYELSALESNSFIAPVGSIWQQFVEEIDKSVYSSDSFHPSRKGAFLAALILFRSIFDVGETSYSLDYAPYVNEEDFQLVSSLISEYQTTQKAVSVQVLFEQAANALRDKRVEDYLFHLLQVSKMRPNHPTVLYHLASAYTMEGKHAAAISFLKKALWINSSLPIEDNQQFDTLRAHEDYSSLSDLVNQLNEEVRTGQPFLELEDSGLHPEGVAYYKKEDCYFLTSVRKGKIVKVDSNGKVSDFYQHQPMQSLMGLYVDEDNGTLWTTAVTTPNQADSTEARQPALLRLSLQTGELLARHDARNTDDWLGDLIVSGQGTVFVSNSSAAFPSIYELGSTDSLTVLLEDQGLASIQGLALNEKEDKLFFSDYRYGLFSYDLKARTLHPLTNETPHPLKAIDGLYYHDNSLIAVHNGTTPFRVVRYQLDKAQKRITAFEYLEKALPEMGEPTLGLVQGDWFYYLVNSPWGAYTKDQEFMIEKAAKPLIRKIELK